jgi:pseudouridine-5'-phosphate glycosidase
MPYPQNKECAISIENQVRKFGAIPATIAVIDGKITVGLT